LSAWASNTEAGQSETEPPHWPEVRYSTAESTTETMENAAIGYAASLHTVVIIATARKTDKAK